jgi:hypothetical protein
VAFAEESEHRHQRGEHHGCAEAEGPMESDDERVELRSAGGVRLAGCQR